MVVTDLRVGDIRLRVDKFTKSCGFLCFLTPTPMGLWHTDTGCYVPMGFQRGHSLSSIKKKGGGIRFIDVHDINKRPPLEVLVKELEKLEK